MRTNTVTYIWKKLLAAAIELPNVTEYRWQSNGDIDGNPMVNLQNLKWSSLCH